VNFAAATHEHGVDRYAVQPGEKAESPRKELMQRNTCRNASCVRSSASATSWSFAGRPNTRACCAT